MDFEMIFEKLGRFNFKHRSIVVIATLTIFLVFAVGLVNIRLENDPQSLWVSKDS
jgi:predicted RND superfamily exporter protein